MAGVVSCCHFGFECDSFSQLNAGGPTGSHRNASTYYMGDSPKAYEANYLVQHMVAFCLLLRRRYPHVLLSIENPANEAGGLIKHPLMRFLLEAPKPHGLGLLLLPVAYCLYDPDSPRKASFFWGEGDSLLLDFWKVMDDGSWRYRRMCGKDGCVCGDQGRHLVRRAHGVRGESHYCNTETYPDGLCFSLMMSYHQEVLERLQIDNSQSLVGDDGSYGHCCAQYDTQHARFNTHNRCTRDGELVRCCACPRTFHEECIEAGAVRRSGGWLLCALCAPGGWQMLMPRTGLEFPPEGDSELYSEMDG